MTGVGLKSTLDMAKKMPKIRADFELVNREYIPLPEEERNESKKSVVEVDKESGSAVIYVTDSKEG